jgi:hypothetical protein
MRLLPNSRSVPRRMPRPQGVDLRWGMAQKSFHDDARQIAVPHEALQKRLRIEDRARWVPRPRRPLRLPRLSLFGRS